MLRGIIESALKLRFLVVILASALLIVGIIQLRSVPVDVYPEFNPPLVEIQTEALGLSAAEVEALLTVPMEADLLNGIAWLDQIYSESVAGLSSILLVFEPGTDPIRARQMVQERLTQTFALPNVSLPPTMLQPLSTSNRLMTVALSSEQLSLIDLSVLARWNVKPRLMGVPGVANVAIWGQRERQLQVQVDPVRLRSNGVTLQQVIATAGEALWVSPLSYLEASSPGTAGWIDTPNQRLSIRHLLPISSAEDLGRVTIANTDGLLLGDVASVVEDHQPLIGDATLNDGPGLLLVVEKFPGANTLETTRGVEEALAALQPGLPGVEIDPTVFRPANYIEQGLSNLSIELLIGALLALIVLAVLYWDWRTILISVMAILLSLLAAAFVLNLANVGFNLVVLAGLAIAIGVIVDDAIIDPENIKRRLQQHQSQGGTMSTLAVIREASAEMRSPAVYATLILLLVGLPLFFLEGLSAAFFMPLAAAYITAMLASLVVALVVTPALSAVLMGEGGSKRESPLVSSLRRVYEGFISRTIGSSTVALAVAGLILAAGLIALPFLQLSLLPTLQQTELLIDWNGPPGTSGNEMSRIMNLASREIQALPGVRNAGSHVGRAQTGDQIVSVNSGELWVSLDPATDYHTVVAEIDAIIADYPGLEREVQAYQPRRISEVLEGPAQDIVVRVYGHDLDVLREKAREVQLVAEGINGVTAVTVEDLPEEPQVEITPNLTAAERHQLKPGDIRRAATTLLSGLRVGNLYEEQKIFDVVVWGIPEIRSNLTNVSELLIDAPGGQVRLGDVAEVRIVPAPVIIRRDAVARYIDVNVTTSGVQPATVASDIKAGLASIEFPVEYRAELQGTFAEQQATRWRIIATIVIATIGAYLLLQACFASWRLAAVAFFTLPVALAGGVLAMLLGGGVVSLGSLFGLITVLSIALRNSIVLITHYQELQMEEGIAFGRELVVHGAGDRLSPIIMTAVVTALIFLPVIVAGERAGTEILHPMALVILGGLVTSTVLNLYVVPALYLRFGSSPATEQPPVAVEEGAPA